MNKSGFVIANQHEEYLASFTSGPGIDHLVWSRTPLLAKVFSSRSKTAKVMKRIGTDKYSLWLLSFSENATQIFVGCADRTLPPWFNSPDKP